MDQRLQARCAHSLLAHISLPSFRLESRPNESQDFAMFIQGTDILLGFVFLIDANGINPKISRIGSMPKSSQRRDQSRLDVLHVACLISENTDPGIRRSVAPG